MASHIKNVLMAIKMTQWLIESSVLTEDHFGSSTHINHVITALGELMPLLRLHDHTSMAGDYTENTDIDTHNKT